MKMEVKEMNSKQPENNDDEYQTENSNNNEIHKINPDGRTADRFYTERFDARTTEYISKLTFLEEKGIFWKNVCYEAKGIKEFARLPPQQSSRVNIRPIPPPLPGGLGFFALFDENDEDANFNHLMEQRRIVGIGENVVIEPGDEHLLQIDFGHVAQRDNESQRSRNESRLQSDESIDIIKTKGIHIPVKCHRHLYNRHVNRDPAVNDRKGGMTGSSLCLSADFFHPVQQTSATLSTKIRSSYAEHNVISKIDIKVYSFETDCLYNGNITRGYSTFKASNFNVCRKPEASLREIVQHYEKCLLSALEHYDYQAFD